MAAWHPGRPFREVAQMNTTQPSALPRAKLASGARRMRLNAALGTAAMLSPAIPAAAAVLVVLQRFFYLDCPAGMMARVALPGWTPAAAAAGLLIPIVAGLAAYMRSSYGLFSAATAADSRLGLRERISSAFAVDSPVRGNPMTATLLADARGHLDRLNVRRDFPLRVPRRPLLWSLALLLAAPLLLLLPQADVLGRERRLTEKRIQTEDIQRASQEMERLMAAELQRRAEDRRPAESLPSQKLQQELSQLVQDMKEAADREQALARLNQLDDQLKLAEQRMTGMAEMMKKMEQLRRQGDAADLPKGPAAAAAAAMAAGNFKQAAAEMERLKNELEAKLGEDSNKLTPEEKETLQRDLEKLAKLTEGWKELSGQFEKAADAVGTEEGFAAMQQALDGLEELAELLKELGLDDQNTAAKMGQEMERLQLTQEMVDQLKNMLRNAKRCAVCRKIYCLNCDRPTCACEGLEQCDCPPCDDCGMAGIPGTGTPGGGSGNGGAGGSGQSGGDGGGAGNSGGSGSGMGGYGQGEGGQAPEREHETGTVSTKVRGQMHDGRIISHMFQRGAPTVSEDEKPTEYHEAHAAAAKAASEEISTGRIPRELRGYVRDYFTATGTPAAGAPGSPPPSRKP
jgi:hypothetical protein